MLSKALDPKRTRPHREVRRIPQVIWGRRKQNVSSTPTNLRDEPSPLCLAQDLNEPDTDNEVVLLIEVLLGGGWSTVSPNTRRQTVDGRPTKIKGNGLDTSIT